MRRKIWNVFERTGRVGIAHRDSEAIPAGDEERSAASHKKRFRRLPRLRGGRCPPYGGRIDAGGISPTMLVLLRGRAVR